MISPLASALDFRPAQPISILLMNGTEDPLMPFEGGKVRFFRQKLGPMHSTADSDAFWVAAKGCDPTPESEQLPDLDPDDGTLIGPDTYSSCAQGVSVMLYTVDGGGQTWPGGA